MSDNSGASGGYRIRAQRKASAEVLVPEEWYDARIVWCANQPRYYTESAWKKEPFKRYSVQFGIIFADGRRETIYCSMPWPLDDGSFSSKSAIWTLGDTVMGEGYMDSVTDGERWLNTGDWLGQRLQVYPTIETYQNRRISRVKIDTYSGNPHIRVPREVDPTSTRLLWEKARSLGANRELMVDLIREFSIPTPDPSKWLLAEQQLVNHRLNAWIEKRSKRS